MVHRPLGRLVTVQTCSFQFTNRLCITEKPTIVNTSSPHQHFLVGQNVVFYCEGVGRPDPRTLWLRNGKKINNADSARYTVISEYDTRSSWLLIKNAKLHDAGNYTCRLLNSHGHQDFTATLTVQDPPNSNNKYAQITVFKLYLCIFTQSHRPSQQTVRSSST